jgi:sortase B
LLIDRYNTGPAEIPEEIVPVVVEPQPEPPAPEPEPEPEPPDDGIRPPDRDIDFDALLEINEDTIAWIAVPGTLIDYPVVTSKDNYDYLERGFDGKHNWYGTPFMDMGNSSDFSDRNTVIYGHNMNDGTMFAGLHKFRDLEFFEETREIKLYTQEGMRTYEIFAAYITDDRNILFEMNYSDDEVWAAYTSEIFSIEDANLLTKQIGENDQILTLSTCVKDEFYQRYLVQGLLIKRSSSQSDTPFR